MKLKEIRRTSTFAWSPSPSLPLLATGTAAGALDASFSNESRLEIWAPNFLDKDEYDLGVEDQHGPRGLITDTSRFHRLGWANADQTHPEGIIAAGMENGELVLWDPAKIVARPDAADALILRNSTHGGPIRGLDFNPIQTHLLSSGGIKGEVYVWDLKDPSKPYSPTPGTRTTKLDEITSVAWNQQVQYVLAGASNTGYTVVWDLRGKREVVALAYGGGNTTMGGPGGAIGGRRGMSDIAWHPDNATRLVTASEDDSSPIIMVWDLRNARAPEKILTGHEKGILSLSWCKQDADLLLSCGKDNRVLCWNPQTSEVIGELPSADNWAFQVAWCPRNPDLLATAFFDGTIGIHSIQSTNEAIPSTQGMAQPDGADIFDVPGFSRSTQGTLSLKQPPKWLRRPATNSWGFGGKLVTVSNLPSSHGKNQSSVVHLRKVVTEEAFVQRAQKLQTSMTGKSLNTFAEEKSAELEAKAKNESTASWKALLSLFKADSRDELVTLLGFSKSEIAARVAEAVANVKKTANRSTLRAASDDDLSSEKPHGPVVSFVEPERSESSDGDHDAAKTPSELSASATSDVTNTTRLADGESITTTAPSLFGDDNALGNAQDAEEDFFSTIGVTQAGGDSQQVVIPHHNYGLDSSVAATVGSGPSSVASENFKNVFRIYPNNESETNRLVTKALVLGDFESAVELCLSSERYADAILLAVKGGGDLLQRTQKAYFDRQSTSLPYLRLFQSIVTNDLADIVQNADLKEWQEIFVVLCTFATKDEFPGLAEELGRRLEFQNSDREDSKAKGSQSRKNATLTYLAAGRLERLVNIWLEELVEEERQLVSEDLPHPLSRYTAHVYALQSFIEKVTVFRSATNYVDEDISNNATNMNTFKLSALYDRYFEYAGLLASQGLVKEAVEFFQLVPNPYQGSELGDYGRDQLLSASRPAVSKALPAISKTAAPATATSAAPYAGYGQKQQPAGVPAYQAYNVTGPSISQPSANPYALSAQQPSYQPASSAPYASSVYSPHAPTSNRQSQPSQPSFSGPSPPRAAATPPVGPPPKRRENGGWNDAPVVSTPDRRSPAAMNKPAAISTPFPNAPPVSPYASQSPATMPPPPLRPGSVSQGGQPQNPPGPGPHYPPPPVRPLSGPPGSRQNPPPSRMVSPPQGGPAPRHPPPGQYASAPPRGAVPPLPPSSRQTPPPSQFTHPPLPAHGHPPPAHGHGHPLHPAHAHTQPPQGSGYVQRGTTPPGAGQAFNASSPQGPYAAPPPQPQVAQPAGPYGPPPGVNRAAPPPAAPGPRPGPGAQTGTAPSSRPPAKSGPPPSKYPVGDRSHIPEYALPAFNVISEQLNQLRQTGQPQQKRLVDDLERRINPLFDALNCETLSRPVVDHLLVLTRAMAAHDREAALAIHVDLLTRGSQTDDIGLWMSGIKQLIMRL